MSLKDLKGAIRDFAREMDDQAEAAYALWTWLPSCKVTEKYHDDYACNFQPSVADLMREARMLLSKHAGYEGNPEEQKDWFERCCCGNFCETKPVNAADERG